MARDGCLFCAIVAGSESAHLVIEDPDVVGFLDHRPVFKGHTLVVPREHIVTLLDLPERLMVPLFQASQRVARAVVDALGADGSWVSMNNVVSQAVPHLHVHVVPRRRKDGLRGFYWPRTRYESDDEMAETAEKLRAVIARGRQRSVMTNPLSVRGAVAAATAVAATHGVRCDEPRVLKHGANVILHLAPTPVVARVAAVTAIVRPNAEWFLARDLAVSAYAFGAGAAVVPPSDELPPGPHTRDGRVFTFFRYVDHQFGADIPRDLLGAALAELHAILVGYDGETELPYVGPVLGEIPDIVRVLRARGVIDAAEADRFEDRLAACAAALPPAGSPGEQALHGDAHRNNVLRTANGLVWTDFEDTCRGNVGWDLACARRSWPETLAAYPQRPTDAELAPFLAARELQAELWERIFAARDRGDLGPMEFVEPLDRT